MMIRKINIVAWFLLVEEEIVVLLINYIKTELGLNPLAIHMIGACLQDLAICNQSSMCGKLGVEHILVSADIRKKK